MIIICIVSVLNRKGSQADNGHLTENWCTLWQGPKAGKSTYPGARRARIHSSSQQSSQLQPYFELGALRERFLCKRETRKNVCCK